MTGWSFVLAIQFTTWVPRLQDVVPSAIASRLPTGVVFRTSVMSPTITSGPVFTPQGGGGWVTPIEKVPLPVAPPNPPIRILYTLAATPVKITVLWKAQLSSLQPSCGPTQPDPSYTTITV